MVSDDFKFLFVPPARACGRVGARGRERERGGGGGGRNERAAEINSYAIQIKMSIFGRG